MKGIKLTKEELVLENLVLRNALDRIAEYLEICDASSDDCRYPYFAGSVGSVLSTVDVNVKDAWKRGYTLDFRNTVCANNEIIRLFPDGQKQKIDVSR